MADHPQRKVVIQDRVVVRDDSKLAGTAGLALLIILIVVGLALMSFVYNPPQRSSAAVPGLALIVPG